MKWTAWVPLAISAGVAVVLIVMVDIMSGQIGSLRQQVNQSSVVQMKRQIAGLQASVNGQHRNLLTCGDLNAALNGKQGPFGEPLNSYLSQMGTGISIVLPPHCLNN
jgi:hypothetical protein